MPLPHRSRFHSLAAALPWRTSSDCPILAVGSRAVVTCPANGARSVTLTDADGVATLHTLAAGAEVEILAWRPRRAGGTRYRVMPTKAGTEGWLSAGSLKPCAPAPQFKNGPEKSPRAPQSPPAAKALKRPAKGVAKRTR